MSDKGFIVIDRVIDEWGYWGSPTALALWIHILISANWKDGYFKGEKVKRGEFITSIGHLAEQTGVHPNTARRWLKKFKNDKQVVIQTTNKYTKISVVNYAKYQDYNNDMVKQVVKQDSKQVVEQVVEQVVYNRTKQQRNKETSIDSIEIPTLHQVSDYVLAEDLSVNPIEFYKYYSDRDWRTGDTKIKDWRKVLRTWEKPKRRSTKEKVKLPSYIKDQEDGNISTTPAKPKTVSKVKGLLKDYDT